MKELLTQIFEKAIELGDEEYTDEQVKLKWIGNPPAKLEEIKKTEDRLNVALPDDYKSMLMIANGFPTSCNSVEPSFQRVEEIVFFREYKYSHIDIIRKFGELEDVVIKLERSIMIAGYEEEQQFLIIPPFGEDEKWEYWKSAHWIPGEEPYVDLKHYFESVIQFLNEQIEQNIKS